jgi:transposase-like protein
MLEETLREDFEKYLKKSSSERLQKLTNAIQRFYEKGPACPQCKKDDVYKFGTNPRKSGREQQYRCKKCSHIYTKSSIKTKEKRTEYPNLKPSM